mgnify:CR=1 FL=1
MQKVRLADLPLFAKEVLARLAVKNSATVVALRGDLGAGKTTFTQALARELGITATVQSPTYILMRSYKISNNKFQRLIHIDAYRLENPEEFSALKPEQFLQDPKNLVVVEWPEKVAGALPPADLTINFSSDGAKEGERYIEVI